MKPFASEPNLECSWLRILEKMEKGDGDREIIVLSTISTNMKISKSLFLFRIIILKRHKLPSFSIKKK